MTPARYSVSIDNNQLLKKYGDVKVRLASLAAPEKYDANCRLMGPIKAGDNMSIPQFVQHAFNEEFKFANIYGADGTKLDGSLTKIAFSSMSGLTGGWWDIGITLKSSNGSSLSTENRYTFHSGFDAVTACNQTAQALGAEVQDLIKKVIKDPGFPALVGADQKTASAH